MQRNIYNMLLNNKLSVRRLSRLTNIDKSTLSYNFKKPYTAWPISLLKSIAEATNNTISQTIRNLEHNGYDLSLDDNRQDIQGVNIPDRETYFIIKASTMNSYFEGWKPNSRDIKREIHDYYYPSDITRKYMKGFSKEMKENG